MAEEDHRCPLCIHPTDERANLLPYTGDLATAPFVGLRCGHRFHTHCFCIRFYEGGNQSRCPQCREYILEDNLRHGLRRIEEPDAYERNSRERIIDLWNKEEVFREDVKELKVLERAYKKENANFSKSISVLRREWRDLILPSQTFLSLKKKEFQKRFSKLEHRSSTIRAYGRMQRKKRQITDTYNINSYNLHALEAIPKAPKFQRFYSFRRISGRYAFRIRI
jgi:hypothetical protein